MGEELEKHLLNRITLNCCLCTLLLGTYRHVTCLGELSSSRMKRRMLISLHDKQISVYVSVFDSVPNVLVRVGHQLCKVGNTETSRIDDINL
jgi:hypothetical protein